MEKHSQRNTEEIAGSELPPGWNDSQNNSRNTKESTQLNNSIQDKVKIFPNIHIIQQKISSMPHDDVYILDANLIIEYIENTMLLWIKWVNDHVAAKKQLFVLPRSAAVNGGLPANSPFIILNSSDKKADNILDHVYEGN